MKQAEITDRQTLTKQKDLTSLMKTTAAAATTSKKDGYGILVKQLHVNDR